MALRLALVQPPNTTATLSCSISLRAFSAKVGQSLAPSSTIGSIILPPMPPAALISLIAKSSASLTDTSLIAIVPLKECRMPTLMVSPLAAADAAVAPAAGASVAAAGAVVADAAGAAAGPQ